MDAHCFAVMKQMPGDYNVLCVLVVQSIGRDYGEEDLTDGVMSVSLFKYQVTFSCYKLVFFSVKTLR